MNSRSINVSVGVIRDKDQKILISKRRQGVRHQGLWEFPGGKAKQNENPLETLKRELFEELDIQTVNALLMTELVEKVGNLTINFTLFNVFKWKRKAISKEKQQIEWVSENQLHKYKFPKINNIFCKFIRTPPLILVTDQMNEPEKFFNELETFEDSGVDLVQLRPKIADAFRLDFFKSKIYQIANSLDLKLMLNGSLASFDSKIYAGLHLPFYEAAKLHSRPISNESLLSTSCHSIEEVKHAELIDVDFLYLSPIKKTATHPSAEPMGWYKANELRQLTSFPVYALGGMTVDELYTAKSLGFRGIAVKGNLWNAPNKEKIFKKIKANIRDTNLLTENVLKEKGA